MNGDELSELIQQRWTTLRELLEISRRQMGAIGSGQMSELMRVLSDKQRPLNELVEIAEQLRRASDDDPDSWECADREFG